MARKAATTTLFLTEGNHTTANLTPKYQAQHTLAPSTLGSGMVYIALEELGWRPAVQTWVALALPKEVPALKDAALQSVVYGMFDKYVDGGLKWVECNGKAFIASAQNNLTTTLAMLLQVCWQLFVSNFLLRKRE